MSSDDLFNILEGGATVAGSVPSNAKSASQRARGPQLESASSEQPLVPPHLVESFCVNLSRLSQGLRLYQRDNDLLRQMWERLEETWRLVRERTDKLSLKVTPESLVYGGKDVFKQEGRENMAVRLYRDGVRGLTFAADVPREELAGFLSIFEQNAERWQNEADCVDRLWLLDLKAISYEAVDGFDQLINQTQGEVEQRMAAGLAMLTGDSNDVKNAWGDARQTPVDLEEVHALYEGVQRTMLPPPHLFWSFEGGGAPPVFEQLHRLGRYLASVPEPPMPGPALMRLLETTFVEQLQNDGEGMYERVTGSLDAPAPTGTRMVAAWRQKVEPLTVAMLLGESEPDSPRHEALKNILERYLMVEPEKLVQAVIEAPVVESALPLVRLVHTFSPDPMTLWLEVADKLKPEVLEELLWLEPIEGLTRPVALQFLELFWASADNALLRITAEATPTEVLPRFRDAILAILEQRDPEKQRIASESLRRLNDKGTGIFILNQVRKLSRPGQVPPELLESYLRSLMALGGDRYVDFMAQCLGPIATGAGGFFGRKSAIRAHTNPLGDEPVLLALARYGSPKVWDLLRQTFSRADDDVKAMITALRAQWEGQPVGDPDTYNPPPPRRKRPERSLYTPSRAPKAHAPTVIAPQAAPPAPGPEAGGDDALVFQLPSRRPPGAAGAGSAVAALASNLGRPVGSSGAVPAKPHQPQQRPPQAPAAHQPPAYTSPPAYQPPPPAYQPPVAPPPAQPPRAAAPASASASSAGVVRPATPAGMQHLPPPAPQAQRPRVAPQAAPPVDESAPVGVPSAEERGLRPLRSRRPLPGQATSPPPQASTPPPPQASTPPQAGGGRLRMGSMPPTGQEAEPPPKPGPRPGPKPGAPSGGLDDLLKSYLGGEEE